MEPIATLNREAVSAAEAALFRHRNAVRAVVFDADGNIALLHAVSQGYYGLPGGGVDEGEDASTAAIRECKEEIGCQVTLSAELGTTLEYRKQDALINETLGFLATVVGEKGTPLFFGDENDEEKDSVVVWVPLAEAIRLMETTPVREQLYSQYCIERDLAFLRQQAGK